VRGAISDQLRQVLGALDRVLAWLDVLDLAPGTATKSFELDAIDPLQKVAIEDAKAVLALEVLDEAFCDERLELFERRLETQVHVQHDGRG
jgi:hypothetical protein